MNVQYIIDVDFTQYIIKYVVKTELLYVFNIYDNNVLKKHVIV